MMLRLQNAYIIRVLTMWRILRKDCNIQPFRNSLQNGLIPLRTRVKFTGRGRAILWRAEDFFLNPRNRGCEKAPAMTRPERQLQNAQM